MIGKIKKIYLCLLLLMLISVPVSAAQDLELKKGLGMTPTEFMNKFNAFMESIKHPMAIPTITLEKHDVHDAFRHFFSENIGLAGVMQKADKRLLSLTVLGAPIGNDERWDLMLIYGAIIAVVNPELNEDQRGELVTSLMMDSSGSLQQQSIQVRKDIKYEFKIDDTFGIQFYVTNAEEN
ncbi:MAG: hypothetical protein LBP21_03660 [Synergistaceae bacterium]|jgi:hypothetical protein|nr:hypothetical protein [Synergistaceae bacterium]